MHTSFSKKRRIDEEIWSFLILNLMKINEIDKTKEILSLIERLKEKDKISKKIFVIIKKFINFIPQFQNLLRQNHHYLNCLMYLQTAKQSLPDVHKFLLSLPRT